MNRYIFLGLFGFFSTRAEFEVNFTNLNKTDKSAQFIASLDACSPAGCRVTRLMKQYYELGKVADDVLEAANRIVQTVNNFENLRGARAISSSHYELLREVKEFNDALKKHGYVVKEYLQTDGENPRAAFEKSMHQQIIQKNQKHL